MSAHDCQRGLHVITAFVRHEGDLLVVQRKDDHSSPDRWDAVSRAHAGALWILWLSPATR